MKKVKQELSTDTVTAITHARIFDGERVTDDQTVVVVGAHIQAVGGEVPAGATGIDARRRNPVARADRLPCAYRHGRSARRCCLASPQSWK